MYRRMDSINCHKWAHQLLVQIVPCLKKLINDPTKYNELHQVTLVVCICAYMCQLLHYLCYRWTRPLLPLTQMTWHTSRTRLDIMLLQTWQQQPLFHPSILEMVHTLTWGSTILSWHSFSVLSVHHYSMMKTLPGEHLDCMGHNWPCVFQLQLSEAHERKDQDVL